MIALFKLICMWVGFFALLFLSFIVLWTLASSFMAWRRDRVMEKGLDRAIQRQFQGRE